MENKETNEEILSPEEMEIPSELIDKSGLDEETILNVRRIYKTQKKEKKEDGSGWDFWNERVHVENLLCQRFNYLILCYSLFITAFAVIPDKTSKIILLSIGFIVVFLLSLFNRRAWHKFDINLRCVLVIQEKCNGVRLIDEIAEKKSKWIDRFIIKHGRYNRLIGQTIPIILCLSLFFGILSISLGWWDGGVYREPIPPQQPIPVQNHNGDNSQPNLMGKDTIYQQKKDTFYQPKKDTFYQPKKDTLYQL